VGDQYNHRVLVFELDLALLDQMGTGSSADAPNQLNGLEGVAVRGREAWIADTSSKKGRLFEMSGRPLARGEQLRLHSGL